MATQPTRLLRVTTLLQQNFTLTNRVRAALMERLEVAVTALETAAGAAAVNIGDVNEKLREVKACLVSRRPRRRRDYR